MKQENEGIEPNKDEMSNKSEATKSNKVEVDADVSLLARLLDQDNDENLFLFDEQGREIELEQIAVVTHKERLFAIMHPLDAEEDEAVVFEINAEDEESVHIVDDEVLADEVLDLYHKKCGL